MIKVKDGYGKLISTTYQGISDRVLLSNGGDFGLHIGRNNEANKIVRTDASGYIQAGWINTTSGNMGTTAINKIYCSNDDYIRYKTPANFFESFDNSGNQISLTIGSYNRKLTVNYAVTSNVLNNLGNRTAISGTTIGESGLRLYKVYNNGYPVTFGNILNIGGSGYGELLFQWTPDSNPGHLYYRSKKDTNSQAWSNWVTILDNNNYSSTLDSRYVTLTTNQTVSGVKTFNTQQKFTVATGTSPFTVSSTTVVSNLNADLLDGQHSSRYLRALGGSNYITFTVGGNADTYYPVIISSVGDYYPLQFVNISRTYSEQAPDSWNTATHKGGLTLTLLWNGSQYWDGNGSGNPCHIVYLYQSYCTMFGGKDTSTSGEIVWLRGGGAVYHVHAMNGTSVTATVHTSTYTDVANRVFTPITTPKSYSIRWPGYADGADIATRVSKNLIFSPGRFSSKTYNGSSEISINIPTHTSHLINDNGYWTGTKYWANIAVSSSSSTSTIPTFSSVYTSNWFRSTGTSGWYSETYGGGIYMTDSTWVRTYNNKGMVAKNFYASDWASSTYLLRSDGGASAFNWSGQSGQPTWLWGGNNPHEYYIYNPSNFRVSYANSAGNADTLDGLHANSFQTTVTSTKRDFIHGTLIKTNINYANTNGDPFYLEIKGNVYTRIFSCYTQIQGYIYDNTIINHGVTHIGAVQINGLIAMNLDGNLCFWFPRQGYWEGYSIFCASARDYRVNKIVSILDTTDPGGSKRVVLNNVKTNAYISDLTWNNISGKPSSFTPSSHTHPWSQISGAPTTATRWPSWSEVTGKPSSFPANGGTSDYTNNLNVLDVRGATRDPNYFKSKCVTAWFNQTGTPDGSWYSGLHIKGWHNGYTSWELCSYSSTDTSNNYRLYHRSGNNSTWGSWKTIAYTSDLTWNNISGKPSSFPPSLHTHKWIDITEKPNWMNSTIGSIYKPVYFNAGIPTVCQGYVKIISGKVSSGEVSLYYWAYRLREIVYVWGYLSGNGTSSNNHQIIYSSMPRIIEGQSGASISKGGGDSIRQITVYVSATTLYVKWNNINQCSDQHFNFSYITFY